MGLLDDLASVLPANPLDIGNTPFGKHVKKTTEKHPGALGAFGIPPADGSSPSGGSIFQQMGAVSGGTDTATSPSASPGSGSTSSGFDAGQAAQEATGSGDPKTIWDSYLPNGDLEVLIGGRAGTTPNPSKQSSVFVEGGTAGPNGRVYDGSANGGPVVEKISQLLDYYTKLAQSDPAAYKSLQVKLLEAGKYGDSATTVPDYGKFGADTRKALIGTLTDAAVNYAAGGLDTFDEYLNGLVSGQQEQQQQIAANQPAPLVKNYWTDPNNVAAAAQTAAQQLLGKNLSDEQVQQFVNVFHAQEAAANAANNQTSGNVDITSPDLSSAAQGFVEQNNGTDIGAHRMAGYVDQLRSMILGG